MAKGNMLLGYARGSVGDVTFARVKGQQTAHARNRNPNNPKTPAQMWQRARLATAVNFFTTTRASTFKFAFEDRLPNESDYNAFMRHNMKRFVANPKEYNNQGLPAYGTPYVTVGSLPTINYTLEILDNQIMLGFNKPTGSPTGCTKVKDLLTILKSNYNWIQEGDIITAIVWYRRNDTQIYGTMPFLRSQENSGYICQYSQETLSSADNDNVSEIFNLQNVNVGEECVLTIPTMEAYGAFAVSIIISRNTTEGLKVSTQQVAVGEDAQDLMASTSEGGVDYETWHDYVTASWDASEEAVLQGALS